jgi:hypothetical protein
MKNSDSVMQNESNVEHASHCVISFYRRLVDTWKAEGQNQLVVLPEV